MDETVSIDLTLEELWLMHSVIRHDIARSVDWSFPPSSISLSDKIAEAILFCEEFGETQAALQVTRHDCLIIDACVPDNAKSVDGWSIGRSIQIIQFAARRALRDHEPEVHITFTGDDNASGSTRNTTDSSSTKDESMD